MLEKGPLLEHSLAPCFREAMLGLVNRVFYVVMSCFSEEVGGRLLGALGY